MLRSIDNEKDYRVIYSTGVSRKERDPAGSIVIVYSRVRINRVRLPILLVVS